MWNTSWDYCSCWHVSVIPGRDQTAIVENPHSVGPDQNSSSISVLQRLVHFRGWLSSREWRKLQIAHKHVHRRHGCPSEIAHPQCQRPTQPAAGSAQSSQRNAAVRSKCGWEGVRGQLVRKEEKSSGEPGKGGRG